jgi:exodeoxyribonuclease-3
MKIVSWNINSIRIRIPLISKFSQHHQPDVICFQETKVEDHLFPKQELQNLGFEYCYFSGQKSYNGVAIVSKIPLEIKEKIDIANYGQARHISVLINQNIELHNFYVPAGGDKPDPEINDKFDHKLKFIDWMIDFFSQKKDQKIIILGDINIAPFPEDVWSHKALLKVVSHTPIETEKMAALQKTLNWIDCFRNEKNKNDKLYSWWSYRGKNPLESDRGRRLDHVWITPNLKNNLKKSEIFKEFRIEEKPSDHVPIMAEIHNI